MERSLISKDEFIDIVDVSAESWERNNLRKSNEIQFQLNDPKLLVKLRLVLI